LNTVDYSKYIERTEGGKLDADLEEKFLMMCGQIKSGAVLMTENGKSTPKAILSIISLLIKTVLERSHHPLGPPSQEAAGASGLRLDLWMTV